MGGGLRLFTSSLPVNAVCLDPPSVVSEPSNPFVFLNSGSMISGIPGMWRVGCLGFIG